MNPCALKLSLSQQRTGSPYGKTKTCRVVFLLVEDVKHNVSPFAEGTVKVKEAAWFWRAFEIDSPVFYRLFSGL